MPKITWFAKDVDKRRRAEMLRFLRGHKLYAAAWQSPTWALDIKVGHLPLSHAETLVGTALVFAEGMDWEWRWEDAKREWNTRYAHTKCEQVGRHGGHLILRTLIRPDDIEDDMDIEDLRSIVAILQDWHTWADEMIEEFQSYCELDTFGISRKKGSLRLAGAALWGGKPDRHTGWITLREAHVGDMHDRKRIKAALRDLIAFAQKYGWKIPRREIGRWLAWSTRSPHPGDRVLIKSLAKGVVLLEPLAAHVTDVADLHFYVRTEDSDDLLIVCLDAGWEKAEDIGDIAV